MPDLRRVHRFRDHVVAGVNWRPTRFVDEVPSSRVCDLCRMIPRRILLLPCSHTLCQTCHAANSQGCAGLCPLDQEPFEEAECFGYDFPTRKANTLKVHCWNEEHGCQFEGPVEGMLQHYESECAFHAVECLRCGQRVLHRDLSTHYGASCSTDVTPAVTQNTPSVSTTLTPQGVSAFLEELKTIMKDSNNDQLLLSIQTQMNELTERVRNLESRAAVSSREFGATASSAVAQVADPISSTVSQEPAPQQPNPTEGGGTSSTPRSCSQVVVTSQSRGPFAHLPESVLRGMRRTTSNYYPQHSVECGYYSNVEFRVSSATAMRTNSSWREVFGKVAYTVIIKNPSSMKSLLGLLVMVAKITVVHTKDSYSTFVLSMCDNWVRAEIMFFATRGGTQCSAPSMAVNVIELRQRRRVPMSSYEPPCLCERKEDLRVHAHLQFQVPYIHVDTRVYLPVEEVELEIELSRKTNVVSGHSTT